MFMLAQNIFEEVAATSGLRHKGDVSVLCAHTLLCDIGFRPSPGPSLTPGWNTMPGGMYALEYTHPSNSQYRCLIRCVTLGQQMQVFASLMMGDQEVCGDAMQHTLHLDGIVWPVAPPVSLQAACPTFSDMSREFVASVGRPLLLRFTNTLCALLLMPTALKLQMTSTLGVQAVVRVGGVCRDLHRLAEDDMVWKRLYAQAYGHDAMVKAEASMNKEGGKSPAVCWKPCFASRHKEDVERRRRQREERMRREQEEARRRDEFVDPFGGMPHPGGQMPNPYPGIGPPGIIGGDYDRTPFGGGRPRRPQPRFPRSWSWWSYAWCPA